LKSAGLYPDFGGSPRSEEKRLPRPFPSRHQAASKGILRHEMPVQNRYTIQPNFGAPQGGGGLAESGRWNWGYFGPPTLKSAENAATAVHFPSRRYPLERRPLSTIRLVLSALMERGSESAAPQPRKAQPYALLSPHTPRTVCGRLHCGCTAFFEIHRRRLANSRASSGRRSAQCFARRPEAMDHWEEVGAALPGERCDAQLVESRPSPTHYRQV
jgi:hypothetical protein